MSKKKKCPQCKNFISISAPTCLYCGRPNKFVTKDYINAKWDKNNKAFRSKPYKSFKLIIFTFLFVLLFFILLIII